MKNITHVQTLIVLVKHIIHVLIQNVVYHGINDVLLLDVKHIIHVQQVVADVVHGLENGLVKQAGVRHLVILAHGLIVHTLEIVVVNINQDAVVQVPVDVFRSHVHHLVQHMLHVLIQPVAVKHIMLVQPVV